MQTRPILLGHFGRRFRHRRYPEPRGHQNVHVGRLQLRPRNALAHPPPERHLHFDLDLDAERHLQD